MASSLNPPPFQHLDKNAQCLIVATVMTLRKTVPEYYVWPAAAEIFNENRYEQASRYKGFITTIQMIELWEAITTEFNKYYDEVKKYVGTGPVYNAPNVILNFKFVIFFHIVLNTMLNVVYIFF
jgi:hypothetical protein